MPAAGQIRRRIATLAAQAASALGGPAAAKIFDVIPAKAGQARSAQGVRRTIPKGRASHPWTLLFGFRDRAGFRPLPRPSDFFFAGPKKEVTKKKGPPRQVSPATGKAFGIFVLAIHGSVRKRRPSMAAALRVWWGTPAVLPGANQMR
jgi:hypothetical protein